MKANEAPEKLWIDPATDLPKLSGHIDKDSVKYTRTDAFIEKAERYIRSVADGLNRDDDVEAFISGFVKYMKGE